MGQIVAFKKTPKKSAEALLQEHLPALFKTAFHLTGNRADSEDLLQELVAKLLGNRQKLEQADAPLTWLKRSLYNLFVDHYRRARLAPVSFAELGDDSPDPADRRISPAPSPEEAHDTERLRENLQRALDTLPDNQREIVIMHDVEGLSLPELQNALGEPLGTLKSRLHRARKALREKLKHATF